MSRDEEISDMINGAFDKARNELAEVERLRAENAALREIVVPVAYGRVMAFPWADGSTTPVLFHVGTDWSDLKAKARAVLGKE